MPVSQNNLIMVKDFQSNRAGFTSLLDAATDRAPVNDELDPKLAIIKA
jgi:hypothetical protein